MDKEQKYFLMTHGSGEPTYVIDTANFKLLSRAIVLAYLTKAEPTVMSWILMGETGMSDMLLHGFVTGAVDIYYGKAYITKAY